MLSWILDWLLILTSGDAWTAAIEPFAKLTLRASLAAISSFLVALVLGPRLIAWLKARYREPNRSSSARLRQLHQPKQSTPTMGGLFIVAGLVAAVLVFGDLRNPYVQVALFLAVGLTVVGALDDLLKLRTGADGLAAGWKLCGQLLIASVAAVWLYRLHAPLEGGLDLVLPLGGGRVELGWAFVPLAVLAIVGMSNAVNLTDGLDGLAGGCVLFATGAMALVVYASGHAEWSRYLNIPSIPAAGEAVIVAGAMIGAVLGFLWFNCHPAQVFMGDTGSLPLGGLLGLFAVIARQEWLLVIVGGVFVVETLSVVAQVSWYKWTRRRLLHCAPLHHHFQFQGSSESQIVVRFWIAAALCAVVGLAALKLNVKVEPVGDGSVASVVQSQSVRENSPGKGGQAARREESEPADGTRRTHERVVVSN